MTATTIATCRSRSKLAVLALVLASLVACESPKEDGPEAPPPATEPAGEATAGAAQPAVTAPAEVAAVDPEDAAAPDPDPAPDPEPQTFVALIGNEPGAITVFDGLVVGMATAQVGKEVAIDEAAGTVAHVVLLDAVEGVEFRALDGGGVVSGFLVQFAPDYDGDPVAALTERWGAPIERTDGHRFWQAPGSPVRAEFRDFFGGRLVVGHFLPLDQLFDPIAGTLWDGTVLPVGLTQAETIEALAAYHGREALGSAYAEVPATTGSEDIFEKSSTALRGVADPDDRERIGAWSFGLHNGSYEFDDEGFGPFIGAGWGKWVEPEGLHVARNVRRFTMENGALVDLERLAQHSFSFTWTPPDGEPEPAQDTGSTR